MDLRTYGIGAQIIRDHGVKEMILLSKSKRKVIGLEGFDIKVLDPAPNTLILLEVFTFFKCFKIIKD